MSILSGIIVIRLTWIECFLEELKVRRIRCMLNKLYSLSDGVWQMGLVNLVYMAFLSLVGTYSYNFFITICRFNVPLWFALKCYLALLLWEVCVALVIVVLTSATSTFILKVSTRSLHMLFPLCITFIPFGLNLWIYHHRIEGLYIFFSYHFRYVILGMILVMLILLFGKIGSLEGLLYCPKNDNIQESIKNE